mmetsp:Transcript_9084/g.28154  ORF Transcript_9084/g.28154 Transcript_9084/m.28154 type:complete len:619 (+) Transcript_9084:1792-3648(+)
MTSDIIDNISGYQSLIGTMHSDSTVVGMPDGTIGDVAFTRDTHQMKVERVTRQLVALTHTVAEHTRDACHLTVGQQVTTESGVFGSFITLQHDAARDEAHLGLVLLTGVMVVLEGLGELHATSLNGLDGHQLVLWSVPVVPDGGGDDHLLADLPVHVILEHNAVVADLSAGGEAAPGAMEELAMHVDRASVGDGDTLATKVNVGHILGVVIERDQDLRVETAGGRAHPQMSVYHDVLHGEHGGRVTKDELGALRDHNGTVGSSVQIAAEYQHLGVLRQGDATTVRLGHRATPGGGFGPTLQATAQVGAVGFCRRRDVSRHGHIHQLGTLGDQRTEGACTTTALHSDATESPRISLRIVLLRVGVGTSRELNTDQYLRILVVGVARKDLGLDRRAHKVSAHLTIVDRLGVDTFTSGALPGEFVGSGEPAPLVLQIKVVGYQQVDTHVGTWLALIHLIPGVWVIRILNAETVVCSLFDVHREGVFVILGQTVHGTLEHIRIGNKVEEIRSPRTIPKDKVSALFLQSVHGVGFTFVVLSSLSLAPLVCDEPRRDLGERRNGASVLPAVRDRRRLDHHVVVLGRARVSGCIRDGWLLGRNGNHGERRRTKGQVRLLCVDGQD